VRLESRHFVRNPALPERSPSSGLFVALRGALVRPAGWADSAQQSARRPQFLRVSRVRDEGGPGLPGALEKQRWPGPGSSVPLSPRLGDRLASSCWSEEGRAAQSARAQPLAVLLGQAAWQRPERVETVEFQPARRIAEQRLWPGQQELARLDEGRQRQVLSAEGLALPWSAEGFALPRRELLKAYF